MKRVTVRKDSYYDSVFLMLATREVKGMKGVNEAVVSMGTPMNLDLLKGLGFASDELSVATPNDLVVAVDGADEKTLDAAHAAAMDAIKRKKDSGASGSGIPRAGSLEAGVKAVEGANIAIISVPGAYAAREARKALESGLHVMMFSDNVSLDDEVALKELAVSKGLLMMGPDCGTAVIDGRPLCFANVVNRGPVGIVAASGTGLQEVMCLVDRYGSGISQAVGTGGRDLKNAKVGGRTTLLAVEALAADPATKVLVVISKPPAPEVAAKVVEALKKSGKPAVAHFLGMKETMKDSGTLAFAGNLEEAARLAVAFANGAKDAAEARKSVPEVDYAALRAIAKRETAALAPAQRRLRGLFTGGTLTDEALFILHGALADVWSNNHLDPAFVPKDPLVSKGDVVLDMGDDFFTLGKPHPMIEPGSRQDRIVAEGNDPETAVLLLDVVLGYGSHPDPAGACAEPVRKARAVAAARGGYLPVIASVTGTPRDFQGYSDQVAKLEREGVVVMPSNYLASLLALEIAKAARAGSEARK